MNSFPASTRTSTADVRELESVTIVLTSLIGRFVKSATDDLTATWLRQEHRVYAQVRAPFLPAVHAWDDDGDLPVLVLDDLSGAVWHAPWTSERITRVPGSSAYFDRGFVTYSNAAKTEMLGVAQALIAQHGAVSAEVANAMAAGALAHSNAQLAVSHRITAVRAGRRTRPLQ